MTIVRKILKWKINRQENANKSNISQLSEQKKIIFWSTKCSQNISRSIKTKNQTFVESKMLQKFQNIYTPFCRSSRSANFCGQTFCVRIIPRLFYFSTTISREKWIFFLIELNLIQGRNRTDFHLVPNLFIRNFYIDQVSINSIIYGTFIRV